MVKIRLTRGGTKNKPFYKIVATDSRQKKTGRPLEILGTWQPSKKAKKISSERINYWLSKGAQVSPAVKKLLEN